MLYYSEYCIFILNAYIIEQNDTPGKDEGVREAADISLMVKTFAWNIKSVDPPVSSKAMHQKNTHPNDINKQVLLMAPTSLCSKQVNWLNRTLRIYVGVYIYIYI